MIKEVELVCEMCKKSFYRRATEHSRNIKKGRRVFCGRSCQGKGLIDNIPKEYAGAYDISVHASNQRDEFTPFRYHMKNIVQHAEKRGSGPGSIVEITLADLKEQWEKQDGVCPYTGWKLVNTQMAARNSKVPKTPDRASVDRIDSSKGYIKGNIQFIAFMANVAKHDFHEDELIRFCKAVAQNKG